MIRTGILLFFFCVLPGIIAAQPVIDVVYPKPDQEITSFDSTFVFGNVQPPQSQFFINGNPVSLRQNGAFLSFLPVGAGHFVFSCMAVYHGDSTFLNIPIQAPELLTTFSPDTLGLDTLSVEPSDELIVQPGDEIDVRFVATPGCQARFKLTGMNQWLAAVEHPVISEFSVGNAVFGSESRVQTISVPGFYSSHLKVADSLSLQNAKILLQIFHPGGEVLQFKYGCVSLMDGPRVVELTQEHTSLRTGPGLVYDLFLPKGTRLVVTGKVGSFWRVRLDAYKNVWLPDSTFKWLPGETSKPSSIIPVIRTENHRKFTRILIPLQDRLPFQIEQSDSPAKLKVKIWGAVAETDWIRHDFSDETIRDMQWNQPNDALFELDIELAMRQQWGYLAHYDGTNLLIDIRHPPKIAGGLFKSVLNGRIVCLDAGHHPDLGAVGPTRLEERDANWEITKRLKSILEDKGATVYLTRTDHQGMLLYPRIKYAQMVEADVLISIHNNALPDGVNPFEHNGTSTYYYHPQSYRLAQLLQRYLLRELKLPDHGFYYANLAICRSTYMPAVLVEPAFIIIPEQEESLKQDKFQKKIAEAIAKGVEKFFEENKK